MVLMPGGEQSFCNDFCVNLCVSNGDGFQCDIINCLNSCNLHFGNDEIVPQGDAVQTVNSPPTDMMMDDNQMPPPPPPKDNGMRPPPPKAP